MPDPECDDGPADPLVISGAPAAHTSLLRGTEGGEGGPAHDSAGNTETESVDTGGVAESTTTADKTDEEKASEEKKRKDEEAQKKKEEAKRRKEEMDEQVDKKLEQMRIMLKMQRDACEPDEAELLRCRDERDGFGDLEEGSDDPDSDSDDDVDSIECSDGMAEPTGPEHRHKDTDGREKKQDSDRANRRLEKRRKAHQMDRVTDAMAVGKIRALETDLRLKRKEIDELMSVMDQQGEQGDEHFDEMCRLKGGLDRIIQKLRTERGETSPEQIERGEVLRRRYI